MNEFKQSTFLRESPMCETLMFFPDFFFLEAEKNVHFHFTVCFKTFFFLKKMQNVIIYYNSAYYHKVIPKVITNFIPTLKLTIF